MRNLVVMFSILATAGALSALGPAVQEKVLSESFVNRPIPRWTNGTLIAWDFHTPVISLFNSSGHLVVRKRLAIPEATNLLNAAVSETGKIAVSGVAGPSKNGPGSAFIAWLDSSGDLERIVRTSPFAPRMVAFGSNGTLWVSGRELPPLGSKEPGAGFVLHQYNREGELLRKLLPSSEFRQNGNGHPAHHGFLAVGRDRVGVYSTIANEWIEVSTETGQVIERYPGIPDGGPEERRMVGGVALIGSGAAFLTAKHRSKSKSETFFYRLDRAQKRWLIVDGSVALGTGDPHRAIRGAALIVGSEGNHLVVAHGPQHLIWIPAE